MPATPTALRPVRWTSDLVGAWDGYTDGSTWNGWLNVWVTPETHRAICAETLGDADTLAWEPDPRTGLVYYGGGFTAREVEPGEQEAPL